MITAIGETNYAADSKDDENKKEPVVKQVLELRISISQQTS
jgi:hypothetical protein